LVLRVERGSARRRSSRATNSKAPAGSCEPTGAQRPTIKPLSRYCDRTWACLALVFAAAVVFANVYPFESGSDTEAFTALHLPIALWLPVGIAYAGGGVGGEHRAHGLRSLLRRAGGTPA
jgi:hypothetical protein